jgi:hypothetical protein
MIDSFEICGVTIIQGKMVIAPAAAFHPSVKILQQTHASDAAQCPSLND